MSLQPIDLVTLSKDRSRRGRNVLFRHVADLCLSRSSPTRAADLPALVEILTLLLPKVDVAVRRELAGVLYSMTAPPLPLVRLLLNDVPEVSTPLLRHAALSDEAVAALAPDAGPQARRTLSARPDLSPATRRLLDATATPDQPLAPPAPPALSPGRKTASPVADLAAAANQLRRQRNQLHDVVRAASDWQWETDRGGVLTYLSDGATRAFGRPAAQLVGAPLLDIVAAANDDALLPGPADDPLDRTMSRLRPFAGLAVQSRSRESAGSRWRLAGVPIFDHPSGRFLGYRGTASGIMTRPSADSVAAPLPDGEPGQRLDPAVLAALQTLSHEIRTPLNAILGFSEMIALATRGPLDQRYRDHAQDAVAAGRQLNKVIADILECAPPLSGKAVLDVRLLSAPQVARAAMAAVAAEAAAKSITLGLAADSVAAVVSSDSGALTLCLTNLLRRAVLDSAPDSRLDVTIDAQSQGAVVVRIPLAPPGGPAAPRPLASPLSTLYQAFAEELARRIQARATVWPSHDQAREVRLTLAPADARGAAV